MSYRRSFGMVTVPAVWIITSSAVANAQESLATGLERAAQTFARAAATRTVAVLDFPDLSNRTTQLSVYVSEELTGAVSMTLQGGRVVERRQVIQVIAEERLGEFGLTEQDVARVGKKLGAGAILIGTLAVLGSQVTVYARLVEVNSGAVLAAQRVTGSAPQEVIALAQNAVGTSAQQAPERPPAGNASSTPLPSPLANASTKNFGPLAVTAKTCTPVRVVNEERRVNVNGIRCIIEFHNRDPQRTLLIALNADLGNKLANSSYRGGVMGEHLRTTLVDDRGTVWTLGRFDVNGIGLVGVGKRDVFVAADPTEIVSLLQRQDRTGSNKTVFNQFGDAYQFVYGTLTPMAPGMSITAVMTLRTAEADAESGPFPRSVEFSGEVVIGIVESDQRKSYSLASVLFSDLVLPPRQ